ncbi:hypothetical protein DFJ74DRAFT_768578 [Hyaloraphidium curvatum]|nr:hypothetical protein DFJ74DRAFT_768578 [Hyaloraphidium curvatum]
MVSPPPTVAYYVSGHGFGHATRSVQTISALCDLGVRVRIVSSAPSFLFSEVLERHPDLASLREAFLDVGVVQADALSIDAGETMSRLREFMSSADALVAEEAVWLRRAGADLVLADASFVPCAAARMAGVPSAVVSNFTWDAILEPYRDPEGKDDAAMRRVFGMCAAADYLLRMPGWIDVPAFPDPEGNPRVFDTPLVVRRARKPRGHVRRELGIAEGEKVVLISFGGHHLARDGWSADGFLPPGWVGLVCGPGKQVASGARGQAGGPRLISIPMESVYVPDVTAAADVVLGKLGFGTCCEVLDAGVPFVFVSRTGFREEPGLHRLMLECNPEGSVAEMSHADFAAGNWAPALLAVVGARGNPPRRTIGSDGDAWIAGWVARFLSRGAARAGADADPMVS